MKRKTLLLFWAFTSIILGLVIIRWGDYLIAHSRQYPFLYESFDSMSQAVKDTNTPETSHTVDLPLTTKISCKNMCGPLSRCSITGEQCTSDVDCYGCQPSISGIKRAPINSRIDLPPSGRFRGENEAGKLTGGITPTFSTLTTDIGTQAAFFTKNYLKGAPQADFGLITWKKQFTEGEKKYNKKYNSNLDLTYGPDYPSRKTTTGMFTDFGPLASNAYITNK